MFKSPSLTSFLERRLAFASLGIILCLLLLAPGVYGQKKPSAPGRRSPVTQQEPELPIQEKAARGLAPLSRLYEYIQVSSEKTHRLPALPPEEKETKRLEKSRRVGTVRAFAQPLKASSDTAVFSVPEGEVRVMAAASEGALSVRVRFTKMSLPPGARLFVYSMKNKDEIYGPYEGTGPNNDGSLWSPPVTGEAAAVELFVPSSEAFSQEEYFQIPEVSHIFANAAGDENGPAGYCNLDVTSSYSNAARAVGHLQFTEGGGEYICTGTLLNDKLSDFVPYLITANHCFSSQSAAQSLRVYWYYDSGDYPSFSTPYTDGANLLSTGSASDYTFVRLTGSVPGGLWYNGWTTAMPTGGSVVTGIHHPRGSHKRISFGSASSLTTGCPGTPGPCANFIRVYWNDGVTEGGSSGSELLVGSASDPRYVGNLWGGYSSCDAQTEPDWYGRFDLTYQNIHTYLDPPATPRTLTVASSAPASGVFITASPSDLNGLSSGTTQFARTYNNNTVVSLTAPATAGANVFQKWQRNGVDWSFNRATSVTMNANYTMRALYVASDTTPPTLTITSHTNGQSVSLSTIILKGAATDSGRGNNGISSVTVNGVRATGDTAIGSGTANWSRSLFLNPGANTVTVVAKDGKLNSTSRSITINRTVTGGPYTISGYARVGTIGLGGVKMTLTGGAGFTPRTILTTSTGLYTFTGVPAGRNYTVAPSRLGYSFTPASRTFLNLSANQTPTTASFAAALRNYGSAAVRLIPDLSVVDAPIVVNDLGTITDLNVRIRLNHTYDADLDIYLIGPDGTMVELSSDNGSNGDNYGSGLNSCAGTPTVFDSAALISVTAGVAPFAGKFKPEQSLSVFNGKSSKGTWKLRIIDDAGADVGALYCWELQFNRP